MSAVILTCFDSGEGADIWSLFKKQMVLSNNFEVDPHAYSYDFFETFQTSGILVFPGC
jgi:hypothetical protein